MAITYSVINRTQDDSGVRASLQTASSSTRTTPGIGYIAVAAGVLAGSIFVTTNLLPHPAFPPSRPPSVVEGLTIFAVFFVGAQALERLLEPVALFLQIGSAEKTEATDAVKAATEAAADPNIDQIDGLLSTAADAKAKNAKKNAEKTILYWGFASGLAALASGTFGFYFLSTVGIQVPQLWMEILGTALIVGAGTKPLHDLVVLIEKKKESAAEAAPN